MKQLTITTDIKKQQTNKVLTMTNAFLSTFANAEDHKAEASFTPVPYLQVLNKQNPAECGLFIPMKSVELAGFVPDENWREYTAYFTAGGNNDPVPGYISNKICLSVLRSTPLTMFRYVDGQRPENLGNYDGAIAKTPGIKLRKRYYVRLRGADGRDLATRPFVMTLSGAFSASFGQSLTAYRKEIEKVFGAEDMNDFFHSCLMFKFGTQPEYKGTPPKANWVCSVASYLAPGPTWQTDLVLGDEAKITQAKSDNEKSETFGWEDSDPIFTPKAEEKEEEFVTPVAQAAPPAMPPATFNLQAPPAPPAAQQAQPAVVPVAPPAPPAGAW